MKCLSDNLTNADNQQERLNYYISGFVDGEGSFHVAIQKVAHVTFRYQLIPEFHVSQSKDRPQVLKLIKKTFNCGYIKDNHRGKDNNLVFVVRNRQDLRNKVVPFFVQNPLFSSKQKDFEAFTYIVNAMHRKEHLVRSRFIQLATIAFNMNGSGKYRTIKLKNILRNLESSETTR